VLKLDIPQQFPESETGADPRPAHAARWLAGLPMLEPTEYAQRLLDRLGNLNRTALTPKQRLRLLEVFNEPVTHLSAELSRRHASLGTPFCDPVRDVATKARALLAEMACGYKIALMDLAWRGGPRLDTATIADAVQNALSYLTDVLTSCYRIYAPAPEGIWLEIHQLYLYADNLGILKQAVGGHAGDNILHTYIHALLLGLSNPYQLPFNLAAAVHEQLRAWAPLTALRAEPKKNSKRCQFLVPLGSDRPGYPCQGANCAPPAEPHIVLDARKLVRKLHDELQALVPEEDTEQQRPDGARRRDLLQRLIVAWGLSPSRRFSRALKDINAEVVVGIDAVAQSLDSRRLLQPTIAGVDSEIVMASELPSADQPGSAPVDAGSAVCCWLRDEGANGVGLTVLEAEALDVRVGNVVGVRLTEGGDAWIVGLVRWIRSDSAEQLQTGIQKLAPTATPVAVEPVSIENTDRRAYRFAILLPEVPALGQPRSLFAPHGTYRPARNLFVETGDALKMVRAGRLLESGRSFDWFEISLLDI
jgi:hypothetical protein